MTEPQGFERYRPNTTLSDEELEHLPNNNLREARRVYGALANSENPGDRRFVAGFLYSITRSDHDFGLVLWDLLVQDEDRSVRHAAYSYLTDSLESVFNSPSLEQALANLGLTSGDFVQLVNSHVSALQHALDAATEAT